MQRGESPLVVKSTAFAIRITKMVKYLQSHKERVLSPIYNQVLRSGTSIMANIGEAQFAQSPDDFVYKLHIALKEASETRKWLTVLYESNCITQAENISMQKDCSELIAMLVSSLNTKKTNIQLEKTKKCE